MYDYLVETPAFTQTRESVTKFAEKCKDFKVAKAEILNIINLRPSSIVELMPVCGFSLFTLPNLMNIHLPLHLDSLCRFFQAVD